MLRRLIFELWSGTEVNNRPSSYDPQQSGIIELRPLVIDLDTVRTCYRYLQDKLGGTVEYQVVQQVGQPVIVQDGDLQSLSNWDLQNLVITTGGPQQLSISFRADQQTSIWYIHGLQENAEVVLARLLAEGRPRFKRRPLVNALPLTLWALECGSWIWYVFASVRSIAFIVAGTILVIISGQTALSWSTKLKSRTPGRETGSRIRAHSHAELRAERANRRANLKVAGITLPAGVLLGALADQLTSWI